LIVTDQAQNQSTQRLARKRHGKPTVNGGGAPVLYIHPAKQGPGFRADNSELGRPYGLFPVGLPALVNVLRENGIAVQGVVHPMEMQLTSNFSLSDWLRARRLARVILIDMHWYEHCYGAVETARLCKQVLPNAKIVIGGLSASGFWREILENFPFIDYIIRGDAEKPLLQLVQLILAGKAPTEADLDGVPNLARIGPEGIVENPLSYTAACEDLDKLNFADIDFIEHAREYNVHEYIVTDIARARLALQTSPYTGRWITTARGCKYHCSYCGGSKESHKLLANRKGLVVRSPEVVAQEIRYLQDQGVVQASMTYDIAEISPEYWQTLFSELRARDVHMGLYNEFFQMPSREFVQALAANCVQEHSCVALSPLSGNERVRRLNGKHYNNEALFDILDVLAEHKFYLFIYFSMNLPGETVETFQESLELAEEIYQFYPSSLLKILNTVHTLDPLSPMNMYADKFGIKAGMSTFMDYYAYCRDTGAADPNSRTGLHRGIEMAGRSQADQEYMVRAWDAARMGKEQSWWPVPPGW
jgi:radical SAM superfamily enzyme YgiQ (UPF0313 family)